MESAEPTWDFEEDILYLTRFMEEFLKDPHKHLSEHIGTPDCRVEEGNLEVKVSLLFRLYADFTVQTTAHLTEGPWLVCLLVFIHLILEQNPRIQLKQTPETPAKDRIFQIPLDMVHFTPRT